MEVIMNGVSAAFSRFATAVSEVVGRPVTFVVALALILVWALSGPLFGFSDVWQLVINTSTTIVTFLMIFVLQNSQNRDGHALQAKLDELILSSTAQNKFIGIEKLDEQQLKELRALIDQKACETGDENDNPAALDEMTVKELRNAAR
jgi:low affinity Fe/Cu permease